jgi:hypothetical protein
MLSGFASISAESDASCTMSCSPKANCCCHKQEHHSSGTAEWKSAPACPECAEQIRSTTPTLAFVTKPISVAVTSVIPRLLLQRGLHQGVRGAEPEFSLFQRPPPFC